MHVVAVVQARMQSTRLPGKVLADLGGAPMLAFLLRRLERADIGIVVATSDLAADDPIVEVARDAGIRVVRGSERDVLDRYHRAARETGADHVVRITADCPLTDPAIVDAAVALHLGTRSDYTSNALVRTYPDGLDVEVVSASALYAAAAEATDPVEREHVTPFVYRHPERFRSTALRGPRRLAHDRWTVDWEDDLGRIRAAVAAAGDPMASWEELLAVLPSTTPPGTRLRPTEAEDATSIGPWLTPILDDLGDRTWAVDVDGELAGWVRMVVEDATGTLSWSVGAQDLGWVLDELVTTLEADAQVVRVRVATADADEAFTRRGFALRGDWAVRPIVTGAQPPASDAG